MINANHWRPAAYKRPILGQDMVILVVALQILQVWDSSGKFQHCIFVFNVMIRCGFEAQLNF